jgi:hypothetical protein
MTLGDAMAAIVFEIDLTILGIAIGLAAIVAVAVAACVSQKRHKR